MYGPPGTGKTMLARVFSTLLPDLSLDEVLEMKDMKLSEEEMKEDTKFAGTLKARATREKKKKSNEED